MKIIPLHKNNYTPLIEKAIKKDRRAQQQLFGLFAPKMLGVCRQYIKDRNLAEEVMLSGFLKVFNHLEDFKNMGSFEGWIRRIMVNQSISELRKNSKFRFVQEAEIENESNYSVEMDTELEADEIQELIDELPDGYKTVFVLYVVEGYKHTEIAELLGISENTSKTQLYKARKLLQTNFKEQNKIRYGALQS